MTESNDKPRIHHAGAPLLPPVLAYALLTVLAVVIPAAIAGHADWSSDATLLDVYRHHRAAVRVQALLTAGAAVPLAVLSAIFSDRIRSLGLQVPGRLIALIGGAVAASLLAVAGLLELALLGEHATNDLALLQFGQRLTMALGGTGFVLFAGLLVAGVAVTGLLGRLLPRPLALIGIAVAAISELSVFTVLTGALTPLLPISRFSGLVWLIAASLLLRRRDRTRVAA